MDGGQDIPQSTPRLGGIILGRLDSRRLPGKVLRPVAGRPLLGHVLDRCRQVPALTDHLVVATTDRSIDDPIADWALAEGCAIYRGSVDDVAGRVLGCAQACRLDWFARLNADSPFVDPDLLRQGWDVARQGDYDFVTNLHPRTFPYGVSVELVRTTLLARACAAMTDPGHREHVTLFLYQGMTACRYYNLARQGENLSGVRLTVDTAEDLLFCERAIHALGARWPQASYEEVVALGREGRLDS